MSVAACVKSVARPYGEKKSGGRSEDRPPVQVEDLNSQLTTLISTRTATLAAAYGTRTDVLAVTA